MSVALVAAETKGEAGELKKVAHRCLLTVVRFCLAAQALMTVTKGQVSNRKYLRIRIGSDKETICCRNTPRLVMATLMELIEVVLLELFASGPLCCLDFLR